MPTRNVYINNLTCAGKNRAAAIAIGSEMSGGVINVTVENSYFYDLAGEAINIKSSKYRGGVVEDITFENLRVLGAKNAIFRIADNYGSTNPSCGDHPAVKLPVIRRVLFRQISGYTPDAAAVVMQGLEGAPIQQVTFENINLTAKGGWQCSAVQDIKASNVQPPAPSNCLN